MRTSLVLLSLSFCAAPTLAQEAPRPAPPAAALADPATAARLADSMRMLSNALLDLRIGNVQAALEGRRATPSERELTVRDLARRNDPNLERDLDRQIAAARPRIEQGIQALNEALPQVTEDLQRAQKSVERAIANMPDPNYPKR